MALGTHLLDHPLHEAHVVEDGHDTAEENNDGQNLPETSTGPGVRGRRWPRTPQTAHFARGPATQRPARAQEEGLTSVLEVTHGAPLEILLSSVSPRSPPPQTRPALQRSRTQGPHSHHLRVCTVGTSACFSGWHEG